MRQIKAASSHTADGEEAALGVEQHLLEAPRVVSAGGARHQRSSDGLLLLLQDAADVPQEREAVLQTTMRAHNRGTTY